MTAIDRGLAYGDGLFETLRVTRGRAPLADWHWQRLRSGAARLGLPCHAMDWRQGLDQMLANHAGEDGIVKLILTAGLGGRGYARPTDLHPHWYWSWHELVLRPESCYGDGLTLMLASEHLADVPLLAGLKHLNRLEQVLARRELSGMADEILLCDNLGRPHSLSSMNLFARFGRQLWTPAVDRCGVAGVTRRLILEAWLSGSGLTPCHQALSLARLAAADEVFAGNAVAGILPVACLGVVHWPVGEATRYFQACYRNTLGLTLT